MTKCAIYIRVSHEEQVLHGYSVEAQREDLTKYAKDNDLYVVDYYVDEGLSARRKISQRKEFNRLIDDVNAGKIELILFTKLDRWFRSIADYYRIQEVLEANKVNWKTTKENYDTSTASGRLHINIMLSVAQDEADRTSERIKFVFEEKIKKGEVVSGSVPYGYKIENKKLVIDKEKEPIVRDVHDYFEINNSIRGTMQYINAKYKTSLDYFVIQRIIKNPCYCGIYKDNNNYCEPYLSVERHSKINRLIKKNQRVRKTKRAYTFSSLLVCEECGKNLSGTTSINRNGTLYRHYVCYNHKIHKACGNNKYTNESKIEDYLLENIEKEIERYLVEIELEKTKHIEIDNSKEINRKLERLKELYINEKITMEEFSADQERIKSQLIVSESKKVSNLEELKFFLKSDFKTIYDSLEDNEKQAVWRSVVDSIVVVGNDVKSLIFI